MCYYHFVLVIMQRLFQIPCLYLPQYCNHCHYCGQIVACEVGPALFVRMDGKWAGGQQAAELAHMEKYLDKYYCCFLKKLICGWDYIINHCLKNQQPANHKT